MSIHFGQRQDDPSGTWRLFSWTGNNGRVFEAFIRVRSLSPDLFERLRRPFIKIKNRGGRVTEEVPKSKRKQADRALLDYCIADWGKPPLPGKKLRHHGFTGNFDTSTGRIFVGQVDVEEYKLPLEKVVVEQPAETELRDIPCEHGAFKYWILDKLGMILETDDNPTADVISFAQEQASAITLVEADDAVSAAVGNSERSESSTSGTPTLTAADDPSETSPERESEPAHA